jgi:hypothetical protein
MHSLIVLLLAVSIGATVAFVSPSQRAQVVKPSSQTFVLRMSEEEKPQATLSDGTLYDDELDLTPQKPLLSDSMKARLIAEASAGLDADKKQTNVLLYIMGVVAVLVLLGGQGILF